MKCTWLYLHKFLKKGVKNPEKVFANVKNIWRNPGVDVFIVSFPKTGRTWLRTLLGKTLCEQFRIPEKFLLDTYQLTKLAGAPRGHFTHDGPFNLPDFAPYQQLSFHTRQYKKKKVIFLIRDIRDTIVSFYFQHTKRTDLFSGDMHQFIRDQRLGVKKVIAFYNLWYQNRHIPTDFLLLRYEELSRNPEHILNQTLHFLDIRDVPPDVIRQAVAFSSFTNMKQLEQKKYFNDSIMRRGIEQDAESSKVRRGKIGGYVDYLDQDDLHYIEDAVQEMGIAGCDWYFAPTR